MSSIAYTWCILYGLYTEEFLYHGINHYHVTGWNRIEAVIPPDLFAILKSKKIELLSCEPTVNTGRCVEDSIQLSLGYT